MTLYTREGSCFNSLTHNTQDIHLNHLPHVTLARVQLGQRIRIDGLDFHAVSRLACDFFPAGKSFQLCAQSGCLPPHYKIIVSSRLYMRHCKMFIMRIFQLVPCAEIHGAFSQAPLSKLSTARAAAFLLPLQQSYIATRFMRK